MRKVSFFGFLILVGLNLGGCSVCHDEREKIEHLRADNEKLNRQNKEFNTLASQKVAQSNHCLSFATNSLELLKNSAELVANTKLENETRMREDAAAIAYFCTLGGVSICPQHLVRDEFDKTLVPASIYFYLAILFLILTIVVVAVGVWVTARTARATWLQKPLRRIEEAKYREQKALAYEAEVKVREHNLIEREDHYERSVDQRRRKLESLEFLIVEKSEVLRKIAERIDNENARDRVERAAKNLKLEEETNVLRHKKSAAEKELEVFNELKNKSVEDHEKFLLAFHDENFLKKRGGKSKTDSET